MKNRSITFLSFLITIIMVGLIRFGVAEPVTIKVAGPPAGLLSLPVYHMMEQNALAEQNVKLKFVPWRTPGQLRAIILSKQADIIAMHTTGAANLHNRGVDLKMMNVSIWNILWVVSTDETIKTMEDLKDKELAMTFKGDMPEIVLKETALRCGLDPKEDLELMFLPNAQELSQHLLMGNFQTAIIPDPSCAVAVYKAKERDITLHRCFNLTAQWNKEGEDSKGLPLAGVAYIPSDKLTTGTLTAFENAYSDSVKWAVANPSKAGTLLNKKIPTFPAEAVTDAIKHTNYTTKASGDIKEEISSFLTLILKNNPESIGGKLPDDEFYWSSGIQTCP